MPYAAVGPFDSALRWRRLRGGSSKRALLVALLVAPMTAAACSASKPAQVPTSQAAGGLSTTMREPPTEARTVHCTEPTTNCFDAARALCGGDFHQVAESGLAFPAMIAEGNGRYRMLVVCGTQAASPQAKRDDQDARLEHQHAEQGDAVAGETATLDQVEADFAKLERTTRWGDEEPEIFQRAHAALLQVAREQAANRIPDDSPRVARVGELVSREGTIIHSPACKRSNAEVEEYNRRAQAEYYSPQAQAARAAEQRQQQQDRDEDREAQQKCEARCPMSDSRDMCIAGCQR